MILFLLLLTTSKAIAQPDLNQLKCDSCTSYTPFTRIVLIAELEACPACELFNVIEKRFDDPPYKGLNVSYVLVMPDDTKRSCKFRLTHVPAQNPTAPEGKDRTR